ncbi:MAG: peroxiredoxin [Candidatus Latescibacterota bacterium]|jgi:peroxiredoxin
MSAKNKLSFPLFGDIEFSAIDAFGISWGKEGKNPLPAPAVFVVDGDGQIVFHYVHPMKQVRLHPDLLLAAVRAYAPKKE